MIGRRVCVCMMKPYLPGSGDAIYKLQIWDENINLVNFKLEASPLAVLTAVSPRICSFYLDDTLGLQATESHQLASDVSRIDDAVLLRARILYQQDWPIQDSFHQLVALFDFVRSGMHSSRELGERAIYLKINTGEHQLTPYKM